MKQKIILLICLFVSAIHLQAYEYKIEKERITAKDGLSSNTINCILQDKEGFIWIGTSNGLDRYDGYSIWNFTKNQASPLQLHEEGVANMHEDRTNNLLWVFTTNHQTHCINLEDFTLMDYCTNEKEKRTYSHYHAGKLYLWQYGNNHCRRIRMVNNKFVTEYFKQQIHQICSDEEGNDWILSKKGVYLNGFEERLPESDSVQQIAPYHGLCIGITPTKVIIYNHSRRIVRKTALPKELQPVQLPIEATVWLDKLLLFHKKKTYIYEIIDGEFSNAPTLQIADGKVIKQDNSHMAYIFDTKGTFYRLGEDGSVNKWPIIPEKEITPTSWHIARLNQTTEAISVYGHGLFLLNNANGDLTHYRKENQSHLISNNCLTGLMNDKSGSLWMMEENLGLSVLHFNDLSSQRHYIQTTSGAIGNNNLTALVRNGEKSLCITNKQNEVYTYDLQKNKSTFLFRTEETIQCATSDKQFNVWLGTSNGVWYNSMPLRPFWPDSLPPMDICTIAGDEDEGIYMGLRSGCIVKTSKPDGNNVEFNPIFSTDTPIRTITCDKQGKMWVTTAQELLVFNADTLHSPLRYKLCDIEMPISNIVSASCSPDGDIWLGTHGNGLFNCSLSEEKLQVLPISIADGLVSNTINSISAENQKWLWTATDEGLSLIAEKGAYIRNFYSHDNPLGNLYTPNAHAFFDDQLYFATNDGFVAIQTNAIPDPNIHSAVYITSVSSGGRTEYSCKEQIIFDYNRRGLNFHFSNLHHSGSHKARYQYRLEGVDNEWSSPSERNTASYRNLLPGEYTFRVRSVHGNNHWGEETQCLITVKRPWWNNWLVMTGILLLLSALGLTFAYLQKQKRQITERKQHSEERNTTIENAVYPTNQPEDSNANTEIRATTRRDQRFIERIRFILEEEGCQSDFTVEELGRKMGYKRTHFYTRVKEATGQTPSELLRQYRLETAARLLLDTDYNVEEICKKCGFGNTTKFYSYFKHQYGLSPQKYRKSEGLQQMAQN